MPSIGPANCWASSGSDELHMPETCSATGSQSRFHVGSVSSIQSFGVQATVRVAPAGSVVAASSHNSARCAASLIARWEPSVTGATDEPSCWRASRLATS